MALPNPHADSLELSDVDLAAESAPIRSLQPVDDIALEPVDPVEAVVEEDPYAAHVSAAIEECIAEGHPLVFLGRVSRRVYGEERASREEFQRLLDALNSDDRITFINRGRYKIREDLRGDTVPVSKPPKRGTKPKPADISIDGLVDVVGRRLRASERPINDKVFIAIASTILDRTLTGREKLLLVEGMAGHPRVSVVENGYKISDNSLAEAELSESGDLLETHKGLDTMLKSWRKDAPKEKKKPFSRKRVHHKQWNNMDDYSPDLGQ